MHDQDLEFVYAEIEHHLANVLADETIKTIIQMLKDYPQLKERLTTTEKSLDNHMTYISKQGSKLDRIKELLPDDAMNKLYHEMLLKLNTEFSNITRKEAEEIVKFVSNYPKLKAILAEES